MGSLDKSIPHFRVHNKVHIPLAVAGVCICQAVEFLRQDLQALGEELHCGSVDGDLSCLCLEDFAFNAHDVTDVQFLELFVGFLADPVSGHIGLNISALIQNITERSLAHHALLHDTAGHGHVFTLHLLIMVFDVSRMACHIVFCNLKRVFPVCLELRQFFAAHLSELVHILFLYIVLLPGHCIHSFFLLKSLYLPALGPARRT